MGKSGQEALRARLAMQSLLDVEKLFEKFPGAELIEFLGVHRSSTRVTLLVKNFKQSALDGDPRAAGAIGGLDAIEAAMPELPPKWAMPEGWGCPDRVKCRRADPLSELGPQLLGPELFAAWMAERERLVIGASARRAKAKSPGPRAL